MRYYLAPMEGITTYIYRNAYARCFGQIDKYFTPFIASKNMNSREVRDILPENNRGIELVPQILTNRANEFLSIAEKIASYGYQTVNLNLGCPSGTVTAKKRGAGFLSVPQELDCFLYEIYEKCPLKISIKTRIGVSNPEEWDSLLEIFAKYPVEELIIHTRLQQEFYKGRPHPEAYAKAAARFSSAALHRGIQQDSVENCLSDTAISLCYNGDIVSAGSQEHLLSELEDCGCDTVNAIMIGRGVIRNPGLVQQLRAQDHEAHNPALNTKQIWIDFHNEILENYKHIMSGDLPVLFKMKDLWTHMSQSFTDSGKYLKKIRKANRIQEYETVVNALFREQEIIS